MRGEALSLFDSAMLSAPSSDHSANPRLMPAVGGEVEVREDPDRHQAHGAQRLEEGVVAGEDVRVVDRRLVPRDVGRVAAGQDGREAAGRVGGLRPDALEVRAAPGQRVQRRRQRAPGRAAVSRDAQSIAPEGVDGDDEDVPLERAGARLDPRGRRLGGGGRLGGHDLRVAAFAVLVDAVAGDVLGARVHVGAVVVAVAAAEPGREAIAVVVGQAPRRADQRPQPQRVLVDGRERRIAFGQARAQRQRHRGDQRERARNGHPGDAWQARPQRRARHASQTRKWRARHRARSPGPARKADQGPAPASRRATAPRRTPGRPPPPARPAAAPSRPARAGGAGRATGGAKRGSDATATTPPGSAPISAIPAAPMTASRWLCILPISASCPAAATTAITSAPVSAARIPAATARSRSASSRSAPQSAGRAPSMARATRSAARPATIAAAP